MFINGQWVVYMVLLNIIVGQVLHETQGSTGILGKRVAVQSAKVVCRCLNNGQCYSPSVEQQPSVIKKKQVYCRCPSTYIGQYCQISATELTNPKQVSQRINSQEYKYFYFQPIEQNMYSFSFDLCLNEDVTTTNAKLNDDKEFYDQITIFLTTENEYGQFEIDQVRTKATTIVIGEDQCKQIIVDYTVLLITKFKTIQKFIFGIKLGDKLHFNSSKIDTSKQLQHIKPAQKKQIKKRQPSQLLKQQPSQIIKKRQPSQQQQTLYNNNNNNNNKQNNDTSLQSAQTTNTQSSSSGVDTSSSSLASSSSSSIVMSQSTKSQDYHAITFSIYSQKKKRSSNEKDENSTSGSGSSKKDSKSINDFVSKSPPKIKQNDNLYPSRTITISFTANPFMVEFVVFNILFSLTTLIAFVVVGVVIFVVRGRILGLTISSSLGINSRLINDLKHFDRYLPEEKFIKKEKKQGDKSPSSSELECAICLVKYELMDSIRKLPCQHSFHKSCIDSWCYSNLTCPMCRRNLTQKNLMLYYNSTALELKNSPESDQ